MLSAFASCFVTAWNIFVVRSRLAQSLAHAMWTSPRHATQTSPSWYVQQWERDAYEYFLGQANERGDCLGEHGDSLGWRLKQTASREEPTASSASIAPPPSASRASTSRRFRSRSSDGYVRVVATTVPQTQPTRRQRRIFLFCLFTWARCVGRVEELLRSCYELLADGIASAAPLTRLHATP